MAAKIKVILLQNFAWLGNKGTIVEVSVPYAKNVLFSKWIAKMADAQTLNVEKQKEEKKERDHEKSLEHIKELVAKLQDWGLVIHRQSTNTGKLYAKIDEKEIAKEILMAYKVKVGKENILLKNKIEELWDFSFEFVFEKIKEKIDLKIVA